MTSTFRMDGTSKKSDHDVLDTTSFAFSIKSCFLPLYQTNLAVNNRTGSIWANLSTMAVTPKSGEAVVKMAPTLAQAR